MRINIKKTVVIRFGNLTVPIDYTIAGKGIDRVEETKDLRLDLDRFLIFKNHCLKVIKNANNLSYDVLKIFKFCSLQNKFFVF